MYLYAKTFLMEMTIRLHASELDETLAGRLRALFQGKRIYLTIEDDADSTDETAFVLNDAVARERILQSVSNIRSHSAVRTFSTVEELQQYLNEPGHANVNH